MLNHFKILHNSSMIWVIGDAKAVGYGKEIFKVRGCSEQEQFFYTAQQAPVKHINQLTKFTESANLRAGRHWNESAAELVRWTSNRIVFFEEQNFRAFGKKFKRLVEVFMRFKADRLQMLV